MLFPVNLKPVRAAPLVFPVVKSAGEQVSGAKRDRKIGMGSNITRRDFLNGFGIAVGGSLILPNAKWFERFGLPQSPLSPDKSAAYYPPALAGMRGTTDAVMEVGHALRDGNTWNTPTPDSEFYDLIVVGGGISGLSAAYFFRKLAGPTAKILILENHDDFGGHARRNEFQTSQRMILGYGGTQSIAGPKIYSKQARQLFAELGIDVQRFFKYYDRNFEKSNASPAQHIFRQENVRRRQACRRNRPTELASVSRKDATFAASPEKT